ncbi:acyl-CoA thioesterase [Lederbergia lenta]|uniref:Thioesterase superfamily protein n=1 Tax=Lederbergia lenta TaxID=1467 RepID=A0A2X4VWV3_LEDLE|nr:thioesterase family protein [Lederbergia lenta]MCM3111182.1 acyl-CoA thioesterase [Lederbergia lenta]MEC2325430.1 thioesterase family protein [Lederbergia lenta]SQI55283.1 thioesterase superfamily protein [Lederbergia lenta]
MKKATYIKDMESWKKEFTFFHEIIVRFSETDMFGHMNNTVPFVYFEEARIEYFKKLGFMNNWLKPDNETMPVVADLQCDFFRQVYFGEKLKIYVKSSEVGTSSVELHYFGEKEDGSICFSGRGRMVQYSKKSGKGEPWTEEMKAKLLSQL